LSSVAHFIRVMTAEPERGLWAWENWGPQQDGHCCFSVGRCLDSPLQFSSADCQSCLTLRRGVHSAPSFLGWIKIIQPWVSAPFLNGCLFKWKSPGRGIYCVGKSH